MYDYFQRRYVAPNITAVAAGNFDWDEYVDLIGEHCSAWPSAKTKRQGIREALGTGVFKVRQKDKTTQQNLFMIAAGPPMDSVASYAADTLGMILGDDSGSRLYWALIDPGLVEGADASFHDYEGTGAYYIYLSCQPEQTQSNLAILQNELRKLQTDGVTEEELRIAKSKIMSRLVRRGERPTSRMHTIGRQWTYLHEYRTVDEELKAYDAVTVKKIRQVLDKYPIDRVTTLTLGPLEKLRRPRA
jgi:predicted Zn-dependent peptidase